MKKTNLLIASLFFISAGYAQIQPTPQKATYGTTVSMPNGVQIITNQKQSYAIEELQKAMPQQTSQPIYKIIAGIKGDKAVKAYKKNIPEKPEGYYLNISPKQAVIAANDEHGLFYGVQSLLQLIQKDSIKTCTITDWPDIRYRGVVEGFYGTPWSHEARLRQLDFYGKNKMNVYLYGPKDDPYHSVPNWRKPYPEKEAEQIKALVNKSKENGVIFYWAIHPGQDIKWNNEDRDLLMAKFESMYQLGVRAFAVFFDDISGEGTKANRQADLLNYLNREFVQKKKDVSPLVMCPTEYNKAWSDVKGGYLTTLGEQLDKDIEIMWTGNSVIACIDKPSMEWINPLLKRKAYIWWNFPVSDYVRDHLLIGPCYGNALDIKNEMSGFVSNPMEHAEASKVALYSVADYSWNLEKYDSEASWNRSLRNLLPNNYEALKTFATHCSDLGKNGHGFRREESEPIKDVLKLCVDTKGKDAKALATLYSACYEFSRAADLLLADKENLPLIDEMRPWLKQGKLLGEYGQDVIALIKDCEQNEKSDDFDANYQHARAMLTQMFDIDTHENQNTYQPGVKIGSRYLLPALNELYTMATKHYNETYGTSYETQALYTPYTLSSDVPQLSKQPIIIKGKRVNVSPSNEVITWPAAASISITSENITKLKALSFDLGSEEAINSFTLSVSQDGKSWYKIELKKDNGKTLILPKETVIGKEMLQIRLKNDSGKEQKVYFKEFSFQAE